jgi:hypothetical protein
MGATRGRSRLLDCLNRAKCVKVLVGAETWVETWVESKSPLEDQSNQAQWADTVSARTHPATLRGDGRTARRPPLLKPKKERPASKGRVHKGRTRD